MSKLSDEEITKEKKRCSMFVTALEGCRRAYPGEDKFPTLYVNHMVTPMIHLTALTPTHCSKHSRHASLP